MLTVDATTVRGLYPMARAVEDMRRAFTQFSSGRVRQPQRTLTPGDAEGEVLATMPAHVPLGPGPGPGAFGLKVIAVQPGNIARGLDPHVGVVLLLDPDTCEPLAMVDATVITEIRTAAASAVATDLLALPDAEVIAVLGTGAQARSHIEAVSLVRPPREIRVWGRTGAHARALAAEFAGRLPVRAVSSVPEAVAGADVICTVTSSAEPVLDALDVRPGAHVNAVGAVFSGRRELTSELVAAATVLTDSRQSALVEAGDLLFPMGEGRFGAEHVRGEIGEVLLGRCAGRTATEEITVFESLGLAVQDVVAARSVYERAAAEGLGTRVRLTGTEHEGTER
ncbi:ornithine cyclodeaminase family protein [Streptomyces sp. NRRL F-5727]|uniref:ornithine cyclodeaminase family protein n=1 Tax=Streptomyces sp. NRRL F-5727 TaxID=1463871 RepID=UPI0004C5FD32|nr:ornithine cyclodeaminase family protein [Streptomyces sp. NRRL F-5727]